MSSEVITKICPELDLKRKKFRTFNIPAIFCVIVAFGVPIGLVVATGTTDSKGNSTSPFELQAGIILLIFIGLAIILSRIANPYKITQKQEWALSAYYTYQDIVKYNHNTSLTQYRKNAVDRFNTLIDEFNNKLESVSEIVKWTPQVNEIQNLVTHLKQNILPGIEDGDNESICNLEPYLITLISYLLEPRESLLEELIKTKISTTTKTTEVTSKPNLFKNKPIRKIAIFLIIIITSGIGTYLIAVDLIGIDKNYAFGGSIAMIGFLGAVFKHYLE